MNRRFIGTQQLYGQHIEQFKNAHVYIVGIGGVGSWVAEALARTSIGELTLIDMDVVVESNINRQICALSETLGETKIQVMKQRIAHICDGIKVNAIDEFLTTNNYRELLPNQSLIDEYQLKNKKIVVLDCTDDIDAKLAIALYCRFHKLNLLICGGVGGKLDPLHIKVGDLKDVYQDPLLAKLRQKVRQKGINQAQKYKFAMKCVYSSEPLTLTKACYSGLNCGGYGSSVVVTASVAMIMASECLKMIAK